jgi:hypothetical protein
MMRVAGLALLLVLTLLAPGMAQTTNSTSGSIDSATSRNGYPAGGGTVSLPTVQNSSASTTGLATTTTAGTTGTTTTGGAGGATSSGAGAGGSTGGTGGGGGRGAGGASTGSATSSRTSGTQGGGHFVLCPPSGGGLAPLFTGMDLSCAPD